MRKKSKYIPSSQASIRRGTGNLFTWNVQEPQNEVMQFGNWIVSQQAANIRRQRVLDTTLTGGLGIDHVEYLLRETETTTIGTLKV